MLSPSGVCVGLCTIISQYWTLSVTFLTNVEMKIIFLLLWLVCDLFMKLEEHKRNILRNFLKHSWDQGSGYQTMFNSLYRYNRKFIRFWAKDTLRKPPALLCHNFYLNLIEVIQASRPIMPWVCDILGYNFSVELHHLEHPLMTWSTFTHYLCVVL